MSDVTVVPTTQAVSAAEQPAAVTAFEETTGIRSQIEPDDNEHMNVDPAAASMTVLGALPAIAVLEKEIADEFKKFDPIILVQPKTYALAAIYAHSRHRFVSVPVAITPERVEKATKRRNLLVSTYRMGRARSGQRGSTGRPEQSERTQERACGPAGHRQPDARELGRAGR